MPCTLLSRERRKPSWDAKHRRISPCPADRTSPLTTWTGKTRQCRCGGRNYSADAHTPTVAGVKLPLLLKLLPPAGRPVQITQDLVSFWNRGYHDVKKDLKGRYPKHYWPDDPYNAHATRRARPR